jgi:hypothetical protein
MKTKRILTIATLIYGCIFILFVLSCNRILDKREMVRSARAVLETPDLTKGVCPSGWEYLPPVEPALPEP